MSKSILQFEPDFNFQLIAISSHQKDYRLCWFLNRDLKLNMARDKDIEVAQNGKSEYFSSFYFNDEVLDLHYTLIENFSENGLFLPDLKQADYFLKIDGEMDSEHSTDLLNKIRTCEVVQTAFELEPEQLKFASKLLYD